MNKYAIYTRVSTKTQGADGLGMEAQKQTCLNYIKSQNGELLAEFSDVESGKSRTRVGLLHAVEFCKNNGCTLVIAKLDRLARDVEFTFAVINTGINIYFCDMPVVNTMILGVFASVAQYERELISTRTKAALKAKKQRGESWNTVANRDAIEKAVNAANKARNEKARNNPRNIFFWQFCKNWEKTHGAITANTDFTPIAEELKSLGQLTTTGLEFTRNRARALYFSLKRVYSTEL